MTEPSYRELEPGLYCIDTGLVRPHHTASYLLRHGDELAFFDTGATNSVPALLETTRRIGLGPEAVRYVMPTHVHLDHAGGAGALMAACPNATLVTHHKGAPHMIDPSRLQAGAMAVYGEADFMRMFGELTPVPEARVVPAHDGQTFELGGHEILFIDTPGHANHHGCFFDPVHRGLFTGDTFGLSYLEFDSGAGPWVIATTTPVAFDPDSWFDSLNRMLALHPDSVLPTHYGRLREPAALAPMLRESIQAHVAIALEEEPREEPGRAERLQSAVDALLVGEGLRRHPELGEAKVRELLALDIGLNAQGLHVWLKRRAKRRAQA
jgi:glyoxylase-like metal-dependent hydrolase (beta-lactamase superfamily II)